MLCRMLCKTAFGLINTSISTHVSYPPHIDKCPMCTSRKEEEKRAQARVVGKLIWGRRSAGCC
jgi:hypothetical protein